jgi:diguanylate cyclase (GGDEF)-like protein
MGLHSKVLWLFIVSVALMVGLGSQLLSRQFQKNFDAIELELAQKAMQQLVRNVESEMEHLDALNSDWGHWDGLYTFMQRGDKGFAQDDLGDPALVNARLNLLVIFDRKRQPIVARASDLSTGQPVALAPYSAAINLIAGALQWDPWGNRCGLFSVSAEAMVLCWQPVLRADHSGNYIGSLLMGRVLNADIVARMRRQSAIDFELQALPAGDSTNFEVSKTAFSAQDVRHDASEPGILQATLPGLTGIPAVSLRLRYERDVSLRGREVIRQVGAVLLVAVVLNAAILMAGIYFMITRRLRNISNSLQTISGASHWSGKVPESQGSDELARLAGDVNQLLGVIDQQVQQLEKLSLTDPLTHIANRRAFDERLAIEIVATTRTHQPLALLALDVDYFKPYNDHYGHPAGDTVLVAVSELLRKTASRPTDLPARIGGEEFAILLPNTDLAGALALGERFRTLLAQRNIPHAASQKATQLTVSIGVTVALQESPASVVARVDRAVYQSKHQGRDQVSAIGPDAPPRG